MSMYMYMYVCFQVFINCPCGLNNDTRMIEVLLLYNNNVAGEDDFSRLHEEVATLSAEYYRLGIALNLKPSKLKAIQKQYASDVQQAFDDVLYAWLRWEYHEKHGPPTWRKLVKAVDKINPAQAKAIATAHPLEGKSGLRSLLYRTHMGPWGEATLFTRHT